VLQAANPGIGLHVLFVDDDAVNRKFGGRMLARLKCAYQCVEDGDQVSPSTGLLVLMISSWTPLVVEKLNWGSAHRVGIAGGHVHTLYVIAKSYV
jgi:hypothetical protein